MTVSRLVNRNVVAERGRTSMRLEPELWDALLEICGREGQDMSALCARWSNTVTRAGAPVQFACSCCPIFALPRRRPVMPRSGMAR